MFGYISICGRGVTDFFFRRRLGCRRLGCRRLGCRRLGCRRRFRLFWLCVLIERNDRDDAFFFEIVVDAHGIVMAVADEDADLQGRIQVFQQFQQPIQGFE
jgi:hypothetical protein